MTRRKIIDAQMNLALCQTQPIALPTDKQRELAAALADLLLSAAVQPVTVPRRARPEGDEA